MLTQGAFEHLLDRWIAEGRIAPEQRGPLLADVAAAGRLARPGTIVGLFAAVLVSLAVLAFIAASWQEMPRLLRLGLLLAALLGAYGGAVAIFRSARPQAIGHALLLVGAALFGVCLALVSQMYHIAGDPKTLLFVWGGGALAVAVAGRSRPPLWLALGLLAWAPLEGTAADTALALGLIALAAVPVGLWRWRSEWVPVQLGASLVVHVWTGWDGPVVALLPALHLAFWALAARFDDGARPWAAPVRVWQRLLALGTVVALGFAELDPAAGLPLAGSVLLAAVAVGLTAWSARAARIEAAEAGALVLLAALAVVLAVAPGVGAPWLAAAVILAVAVLLTVSGALQGAKGLMAAAIAAFVVEAAAVYLDTDGSLMASAGFFLVGGIALAVAALRAGRSAP